MKVFLKYHKDICYEVELVEFGRNSQDSTILYCGGKITSNLLNVLVPSNSLFKDSSEMTEPDMAKDSDTYNKALICVAVLEKFILAQACESIDVSTPQYIQSIENVLDSIVEDLEEM